MTAFELEAPTWSMGKNKIQDNGSVSLEYSSKKMQDMNPYNHCSLFLKELKGAQTKIYHVAKLWIQSSNRRFKTFNGWHRWQYMIPTLNVLCYRTLLVLLCLLYCRDLSTWEHIHFGEVVPWHKVVGEVGLGGGKASFFIFLINWLTLPTLASIAFIYAIYLDVQVRSNLS
jgi:hypothetical protein